MNAQDVQEFLRLIGARNISPGEQNGWIRASCPLAPWRHDGGRDNKPSFGIKIGSDDTPPCYHCFTCQSGGPLPQLLTSLMHLSGERFLEASNFLSQFELFKSEERAVAQRGRRIRLRDSYVGKQLDRTPTGHVQVPESVLQDYPLLAERSPLTAQATALRWLVHERKISLQSIAKFKLRFMTTPLDEVGIVFPILSRESETVLDLWARLIDDKKFFRISSQVAHSRADYKATDLLFGNHLFDPTKPVILVEGAIDALRLHTLGFKNVLASFGAMSNEQLDSFYARAVYLAFDSDEAGRTFTKKAAQCLNVPAIHILDWSVAGLKDAGELESLSQFRAVFDARVKILRSPKIKKHALEKGPRKPRLFLKNDGTFL